MKDRNKLKDYFNFEKQDKSLKIEELHNFSPYQLNLANTTPHKFKNNHIKMNGFQEENHTKTIDINEELNMKNQNDNYFKVKEKIKSELEEINIKINKNINQLDTLKNSLKKLKSVKNQKRSEIVELLSNRESIDEIYKNYIEYIKNQNNINKKKKNRNKKEIKNPFENQDEDSFEILIEEIKQIDLFKFIDQCLNLLEELFQNPKRQLKLELKEIINKSFYIFNNEANISNFIDTYSLVSNFFLRISLFLSNKSQGKYSETIINLFLRCLVKINSINAKNDELINYLNGEYKREKMKLKEEINNIMIDNEMLNINKIIVEKKLRELDKKNNINKENEKQNNFMKFGYFKNEEKKINSNKRNLFKEKLRNKDKKIYQEDFEEKNGFSELYNFTESDKLDKEEKYSFNENAKYKKYISNTEKKINYNFEVEKRYSFKIINQQNEEQKDFKRFNTINFNDNNRIKNNYEYNSPKVKSKKNIDYGIIRQIDNIQNEERLNGTIPNENKRNKENKTALNLRYNNKILTFNDIKKNMKFDLAKKIKYLDKVNKNFMNGFSKTSVKNKKNKLIYEKESKMKRIFTTEKKEKNVKYNFFDIIQETKNLSNSIGSVSSRAKTKFYDINQVHNNNNLLLRSTKEKKIKGKYDIYKLGIKKYDNIVKSDRNNNKKISIFN